MKENELLEAYLYKVDEGVFDTVKDTVKKGIGKVKDVVNGVAGDANAKAMKDQVDKEKADAKAVEKAQKKVEGDIKTVVDFILKTLQADKETKEKQENDNKNSVEGAKAAMSTGEQPAAEQPAEGQQTTNESYRRSTAIVERFLESRLEEKVDAEALQKLIDGLGLEELNAENLTAKLKGMSAEEFKQFGLNLERATGQGAKMCGKIVSVKQEIEKSTKGTEAKEGSEEAKEGSEEAKEGESEDGKSEEGESEEGKEGTAEEGSEEETEESSADVSPDEIKKALESENAKGIEALLKAITGKDLSLSNMFTKAYDKSESKEELLKSIYDILK